MNEIKLRTLDFLRRLTHARTYTGPSDTTSLLVWSCRICLRL